MTRLILLTVAGLALLEIGYGLDCYEGECSLNDPTCAFQKVACSNDSTHCTTRTLKSEVQMSASQPSVITRISKNCTAPMCDEQMFCVTINKTMSSAPQHPGQPAMKMLECDVTCCQGDGCNQGGSPSPGGDNTTGSTPEPLSCYMCLSTEQDPEACEKPKLTVCPIIGMGKRGDTCFNMTQTMTMPDNKTITLEMRNCTHSMAMACANLCANMKMPQASSCEADCCTSSGCNGMAIAGTTETPTVDSGAQTSYQAVLAVLFNLFLVMTLAM